MKNPIRVIILAAMLVALSAGCQQSNKPKPPKPLTQKEQAYKQWNSARVDVLTSLAKSQFESGRMDQGIQSVKEALRIHPDNAGLRTLYARMLIEQGQLEPAEKELTEARKLDPKNAEAEYLSGIVYQRWQKPEVAYECYMRASQKNPAELAYVLARAEMLVAMDCAPEAMLLLNNRLDDSRHNPVLHHAIGQLLVGQGRFAEAAESLRQASVLAPDDASIREHLAMALFQDNQYSPALVIITRLLRDETGAKRTDLWIAQGECQMQLGRLPEARTSFDTATQLDPGSMPAWLSLAKATLELGDTRRAESVLRKAIALDPQSAEARLLLGYVRVRQNRLNDALTEFQKASALDRGDAVSLCMIGYVLEKSGKPEQAMKYYSQALKIKPGDEMAAKMIASVDVSE